MRPCVEDLIEKISFYKTYDEGETYDNLVKGKVRFDKIRLRRLSNPNDRDGI